MVINAGGSVARFFNVIQSQGNVFEIWDKVPTNEPIKVVEGCKRYFISADEATGLIIYAMFNNGRFIVNTPNPRRIEDIAEDIYPNREKGIKFLEEEVTDNTKSSYQHLREKFTRNVMVPF